MITNPLSNNIVTLRAVEPDDAGMMFGLENDTDLWQYSERIAPLSMLMIRQYAESYDSDPIRAGQLRLIVTDTTRGETVGIADLYEIDPQARHAFVGIAILPDFRRRGYGRAALDALASYSRLMLRMKCLAARVAENNTPSLGLFRAAGYTRMAVIPKWIPTPEGLVDEHFLLLTL